MLSTIALTIRAMVAESGVWSARGARPDKFLSGREKRFRDRVMLAVRQRIARDRIPCSHIIVSGRPMLTAVRARILRDEWDDISLRRAILIADAVGVDLVPDLVRGEAAKPQPRPRPVIVMAPAPPPPKRRCVDRSTMALADLFEGIG